MPLIFPDMKTLLSALFCLLQVACLPQDGQSPNQGSQNWASYLGDQARTHYSPLTQVNRSTVQRLEAAWVYDSGAVRAGNSTLYTSPLIIDGILYGLSPTLDAFALNAANGRELWRYESGISGFDQRGLMWWQSGNDRRLLFTAGDQLIVLHADSGQPVESFGVSGKLQLLPPELTGPLYVSTPGVIFNDSVILGYSTSESANALPGMIRSFDIHTGEELWRFNTLPLPGQPAADTWEPQSLTTTGGANNWAGMTLDAERELLFVPTGSATPDFYGVNRPGDNLYASSLVALDANTGDYRWHFQAVRHDLWDRDLPAPPTLVNFQRDGLTIEAVAQTTKSGHLYLFDRETGASLYPLMEQQTVSSQVDGEVVAATQQVSSVAFTRQSFTASNRSPETVEFVNGLVSGLEQRPWAPPSLEGTLLYPSFNGGAQWGGAAFYPASKKLIVNAQEIGSISRLLRIPGNTVNRGIYLQHCASCHGADRTGSNSVPSLIDINERMTLEQFQILLAQGRGRMPGFATLSAIELNAILSHLVAPEEESTADAYTEFEWGFSGFDRMLDHEGLPANAPPWGTLSSIDLASGELDWQIPLGNYPGHPELNYGAENYGGPVVTAGGLIFIAATPDGLIRALDVDTGAILWQDTLPAAGYATPSVYSVNGKQYIVIAAGGGKLGSPSDSFYVAYSLAD